MINPKFNQQLVEALKELVEASERHDQALQKAKQLLKQAKSFTIVINGLNYLWEHPTINREQLQDLLKCRGYLSTVTVRRPDKTGLYLYEHPVEVEDGMIINCTY